MDSPGEGVKDDSDKGSSKSVDENEVSSSSAKSSELSGESEGVLSHSSLSRGSVPFGNRTLPCGSPYIPSQCSPSNGSSARMSAHVQVGTGAGGFVIACR